MIIVALEGIDASGKTSVAEALADTDIIGRRVLRGGEFMSPIGSTLLANLASLTPVEKVYWFAADRAWTLGMLTRQGGDIVIWDRYIESAFAYRAAEMHLGVAGAGILELTRVINQSFPSPDLNVYLSLPPTTAMARRRMDFDPRWPLVIEYYEERAHSTDYVTIDGTMGLNQVTDAVRTAIADLVVNGWGAE